MEVALNTICEIKNGYAFKSSEYREKGIPLIRISSFDNDKVYIDKKTVFVDEDYLADKNNFIVEKGDVLIALSGATTGKYGLYDFDYPSLLNQRVGILKSGKAEKLDEKYFFYYLSILQKEILRKAGGAAQPNISTSDIGELKIPLPPLPEQKKIAALLDAADAYRQKTKELITQYDLLAQSLFLDMFGDPVTNPKGWEMKKLEKLCGVGSGKRVFVNELVKKGIPFFRGTEIGKLSEGIQVEPTLFITKEHYKELKKHTGVPQIGDLLMPSICPDGRILMVSNNEEFYFKDGRVLWLKIYKEKIGSVYLKSLLKNIFYTNYTNIASGTTFAELKIFALKNIDILTPPLTLQTEFAERIQGIELQKSQAQASLSQAEDLFNSLLQRAFKGELKTKV